MCVSVCLLTDFERQGAELKTRQEASRGLFKFTKEPWTRNLSWSQDLGRVLAGRLLSNEVHLLQLEVAGVA